MPIIYPFLREGLCDAATLEAVVARPLLATISRFLHHQKKRQRLDHGGGGGIGGTSSATAAPVEEDAGAVDWEDVVDGEDDHEDHEDHEENEKSEESDAGEGALSTQPPPHAVPALPASEELPAPSAAVAGCALQSLLALRRFRWLARFEDMGLDQSLLVPNRSTIASLSAAGLEGLLAPLSPPRAGSSLLSGGGDSSGSGGSRDGSGGSSSGNGSGNGSGGGGGGLAAAAAAAAAASGAVPQTRRHARHLRADEGMFSGAEGVLDLGPSEAGGSSGPGGGDLRFAGCVHEGGGRAVWGPPRRTAAEALADRLALQMALELDSKAAATAAAAAASASGTAAPEATSTAPGTRAPPDIVTGGSPALRACLEDLRAAAASPAREQALLGGAGYGEGGGGSAAAAAAAAKHPAGSIMDDLFGDDSDCE